MRCQQKDERSTHHAPGTDPGPPNPALDPRTRGSGGRRYPGAVTSALVTLIGLWIVASTTGEPPAGATAWAFAGLGGVVAIASGYNTLRQVMNVRPAIGADFAAVCCGLGLVLVTLRIETIGPVFWSGVLGGILVAGLAGYNSYRTREGRTFSRDDVTRW